MNKEERKIYNKKYDQEHKEEIRTRKKRYYQEHKKESKKYYEEHKKEKKIYLKKYRKEHKEEIKIYIKKYYKEHKEERRKYKEEHKEEIKKSKKKYNQEHKKEINNRNKKYITRRKKVDIQYKLAISLRCRLGIALKKRYKSGSAVKDLGCSIEYLKKHLESQFLPGMSWNNWGNKERDWSIDHVKPLSKIDLTDREQFLMACHYTNLQPMWHIDNMKKGNR